MDTGIFIGDKIITTSWDKIWNKPNTLSGYGITDAYTQSDADGRFFRYFGYTTDDGDDSMWQKLGTFTYLSAFPDGVTIKRHGYGQVTSFIAGSSRFQLYSTHSSSDPNDGSNGIQFRSGWDDDKKSWRMLLDEVNYLHYTDNRYVNKAGDTMTGSLNFNGNAKIYFNGNENFSVGSNSSIGTYLQYDSNIITVTSNHPYYNDNKIWHAGNDGSGSGLDADLLDGKHLHQGQWDSICYIGGDGVLEIGKFIDFHEEPGMVTDFSCRIKTQGDHHNTITLPAASGTLATLDDNVYSATKLQTPRYIFSKPFDGTSNVTGGAKFLNICIETDNNGNDSGRGSEINNYNDKLCLQHASSNNLVCCMGGGSVGIGTTSPKYTLHVDGVIYAKNGFRETSDIRKKKVLNSHTVDLDDMAYADLFDYTLIDDEKEIVRIGTNAHYWLDKLPQVVTKDNDEYLSLNYGVLGTVCALSVSKYVKQLEDRVTLLENKIASLQ